MTDAELAKELQEATDELLDLGPTQVSAFPNSPHLRQPQTPSPSKPAHVPLPKAPTYSPSSKLEVIHSPTDVRPFRWPAPSTPNPEEEQQSSPSKETAHRTQEPIKIEFSSSVLDDGEDNLPARGLSSRIGSVRAGTSDRIEVSDQTLDVLADDTEDGQRAASPSRLRMRTPVNDIYINQYGERVVQGKVVGRTLGGRPRPSSRNGGSLHPTNGNGLGLSSSPGLAPSTSPLLSASFRSDASTSSPVKSATSPPAFFLESFPDAFAPPAPATAPSPKRSPRKSTERKVSRGAMPMMIKAPRAVAGALTLAHSDSVDEPIVIRDSSFTTASDFGSPSSSSSKHLSPKPRSSRVLSHSSSIRKEADAEIGTALKGLHLQGVDAPGSNGLLSPSEDGAKTKIELPSLRRPTPTIELSQAKAETVLHGNRRQARASGVVLPQNDTNSVRSQEGVSSAMQPPTVPSTPPPTHSVTNGQGDTVEGAYKGVEQHSDSEANHVDDESGPAVTSHDARLGATSEPTTPLMSPRRLNEPDDDDRSDNSSLESAPSSLVSLPVSTHTTSSRSPSHASLERRRSTSSVVSPSLSRRRSTSHRTPAEGTFAREVHIRSWSEVGSQARGWVVFELLIRTHQGTPIIAHKRFSSFVKLRQALVRECKEQAKWLPVLPTRRTGLLSKYDAKYLEKRRRALQRWLEVVMLDKVWGSSEGLREWVLASD